jgi:hypothetical protein
MMMVMSNTVPAGDQPGPNSEEKDDPDAYLEQGRLEYARIAGKRRYDDY